MINVYIKGLILIYYYIIKNIFYNNYFNSYIINLWYEKFYANNLLKLNSMQNNIFVLWMWTSTKVSLTTLLNGVNAWKWRGNEMVGQHPKDQVIRTLASWQRLPHFNVKVCHTCEQELRIINAPKVFFI